GLGTDTGDSIRGPAAHNDLVGIRPTIGLVSRDGIIPLSSTNDIGGPLARTVADAAAILEVVQGYDPADPITKLEEGKSVADYTASLDKNGLKGARIGVVRSYFSTAKTDPEVAALTEKALAELKAQGATIVDSFPLPTWNWDDEDKVKCGGFEYDLNNYFKVHGRNAPYQSLQAVIDSGLYLGSIGERLKGAAQSSKHEPLITTPCLDNYHDPVKVHFRDAILRQMDSQKLDALVYPTWSNPPRKVGDMKSPGGDNSQVICPMTGFPGITVPMGFTHGNLPAGLTFVGRSFSEASLIKLAYAYEQATQHRRPPAQFGPLP
ncbi:MAG: amidase, partial [Acidobacteria bacterium]|nr:amidase [Acidobacteriota bacterium]